MVQCQENRKYGDNIETRAETFNQDQNGDLSSALAATSPYKPEAADLQTTSSSQCLAKLPDATVGGNGMYWQQPDFSSIPCGSISMEEFPCLERLRLAQKHYKTSVQPLVYKGGLTEEDIKNDPYGLGFMESKWSRDSSPTHDRVHNMSQNQYQRVCDKVVDEPKVCDNPQLCQSPRIAEQGLGGGDSTKTRKSTEKVVEDPMSRSREEISDNSPDTHLKGPKKVSTDTAKNAQIPAKVSKKPQQQTRHILDNSEKGKSTVPREKAKTGGSRNKRDHVELNKQRGCVGWKGKALESKPIDRTIHKVRKNRKKPESESGKVRQPHMQRILTTVHRPIAYGKGQTINKITASHNICRENSHHQGDHAASLKFNATLHKKTSKSSYEKQRKSSNQPKPSRDASRNTVKSPKRRVEPPYQVPIATYVPGKVAMTPKPRETSQGGSCPAFIVGAQTNPGFECSVSTKPQPLPGRTYQHPMYIPFIDKSPEPRESKMLYSSGTAKNGDEHLAPGVEFHAEPDDILLLTQDTGKKIVNAVGKDIAQEFHGGQENESGRGNDIKDIQHRNVQELPFRKVECFHQRGSPLVLKFELLKKFDEKVTT